jgi:hypothetical protein
MTDFFDALESQLHAAARAQIAVDRLDRRPRRLAVAYRWAAPFAAAAVAVLVAVVALTSLRSGGRLPISSGNDTTLSAPLVANFAVLRQAQTPIAIPARLIPLMFPRFAPAARQVRYRCAGQRTVVTPPLSPIHATGGRSLLPDRQDPQIECLLMRFVRIPQWHARVVIAPVTFRPGPSSPARVQGVDLILDDPDGGITGTTGTQAGVSGVGGVLHGGLSVFENARRMSHGIILIPDGVENVTLDDFRLRLPHGSRSLIEAPSRKVLATLHPAAGVRSNIAEFSFPTPTVTLAGSLHGLHQPVLEGVPVFARETWRSSTGAVIRRFRVRQNLLLRIRSR